jgi:hypothetical protein
MSSFVDTRMIALESRPKIPLSMWSKHALGHAQGQTEARTATR